MIRSADAKSVNCFIASTAATLMRCAPALPPKTSSVNFSFLLASGSLPTNRISRFQEFVAGKISDAFPVGGENAIDKARQDFVRKARAKILFHNGAANAFQSSRQQQRTGSIAAQSDDQ